MVTTSRFLAPFTGSEVLRRSVTLASSIKATPTSFFVPWSNTSNLSSLSLLWDRSSNAKRLIHLIKHLEPVLVVFAVRQKFKCKTFNTCDQTPQTFPTCLYCEKGKFKFKTFTASCQNWVIWFMQSVAVIQSRYKHSDLTINKQELGQMNLTEHTF